LNEPDASLRAPRGNAVNAPERREGIDMAQPYVGQIIAVGFPFAPDGWLVCDGSLLPISGYEVLYNLIGTTYGGNGTTNFAVPDLRGRSPLSFGQGPGLANYIQGQSGGAEAVSLHAGQVGAHSHALGVSSLAGSTATPGSGLVLGQNPATAVNVYAPAPATTALASTSLGPSSGEGQPHENRQPFLAINYIICAFGIYPPQS
jgi:microcystin-dependent protein